VSCCSLESARQSIAKGDGFPRKYERASFHKVRAAAGANACGGADVTSCWLQQLFHLAGSRDHAHTTAVVRAYRAIRCPLTLGLYGEQAVVLL
jgi:hypothetical protein